jgi:hypothetical protein
MLKEMMPLKNPISRRDLIKSSTAFAAAAATPSWGLAQEATIPAAQAGRGSPSDPPLVRQMGSKQYFIADDTRKAYEEFLLS